MSSFWKRKRVLVTGGFGFIGSHLVDLLLDNDVNVSVLTRSKKNIPAYLDYLKKRVEVIEGDVRSQEVAMNACKQKDVVFNLAAHVGGISYNQCHHVELLTDNFLIQSAILEGSRKSEVERTLVVSTACVYPHDANIPTQETEGFRGEPEETNGGYGWGKRMAEKLAGYYVQQYGMKIGIVRPYNAYGPRDHFRDENGHVIPSLIRRIYIGENPLSVWGSGRQTRCFMYVKDIAEGMLATVERYPVPDAINLGSNEEVSIADLVSLLIFLSKKSITIVFDTTKPDGSPRRKSDQTKAEKYIKFYPKTSLEEGLRETIAWYERYILS